jgi:hypothetical protein
LADPILDLERLRATPLRREPFDFVVVEDFLHAEAVPALCADYPALARHGSFPVGALRCGPAFLRLVGELEGAPLRAAVEEKFAIDLAGRPTMVTVRGRGDRRDGRIHTDSASKLVTMLIYLNPHWTGEGGRLRLLRDGHDLENYVAEVAPVMGMMLAFRRSETSFHGHHPHNGERRSVQLNWVTDQRVVRRETGRHRLSAWLKALNPFAG